ncbi:MAG: N-acetylmuramoyl-L-alanine amidase [Candidatus Dadabacteria bacterium]|nr:MAG: N-acetylmuramoyl-L-alanine amidase [Candidatus Dadabacteria bacterium]
MIWYLLQNRDMRVRILIALTIVVVLLQGGALACFADSAGLVIEQLNKKYFSLRNTDTDVRRLQEWKSLAAELQSFAERFSESSEAAFALQKTAIIYQQIFRHYGKREALDRAIKLLKKVQQQYPRHDIADDVLVQAGDIYLYELRMPEQADKFYRKVIVSYPDSDMYSVAVSRRKQLLVGRVSRERVKSRNKTERRQAVNKHRPVIVIDPGHGGEDLGARGVGGLLEKDVVLAVALELKKLLSKRLNAIVRLTRSRDVFIPLAERTNLANDFEADLFISLHVNASRSKKLTGFETYYLDNTNDKSSRKLAERENASMSFEGEQGDLQFILSDLIQNAKLEESIMLAHTVNDATYNFIKKKWPVKNNLGVKKAPFYVLVGAHMPCILVEMFFIDNKQNGLLLAKREFRKDLAWGLFNGIKKYLETESQQKK